jgi:YggT family protein
MFILANFLSASANVLDWIFQALEIIIVVRVVLSWANADPYNGLVRTVTIISEPFLIPIRRIFPPWRMKGLDISPVFALLALFFVRMFLVATLYDIVAKLK